MEDTIQPFTHQQSIADEKHTIIEDEQQFREDLIQRATTRLRRRRLEESLSDVMEQIIKLQTHLETIRVDTQTTIGSLTNMLDDKDENIKLNRQMDILERRLRSHKTDLDRLQSTTVIENKETNHNTNKSTYQKDEEEEEEENAPPQPTASMSRLSSLSLMSSIFGRTQSVSSKATSISSNSDENRYQSKQQTQTQRNGPELLTEEQKRDRRRRRVRNQRQRYEESLKSRSSCGDDDDDCISQINGSEIYDYKPNYPTIEEDDNDAPFYDLSGKRSFHAGSFCGSVYCKEQKTLPIPQAHDTNIRRKRRHHQYFQQQQQQYQHENDREYPLTKYYPRCQDDEDECLFDCHTSEISSIAMSDDTISTLSSFIPDLHHPLSPMTPPPDYNYYNENAFGSSNNVNDDGNCHCYHMQNDKNNPSQPCWSPATMCDSWALENLSNDNNHLNRLPLSLYPQRNVLDDAISFLDGLGENDDDGGLREDMCLLLQNPELCCRPLSEIQSAMDELRSKENNKNLMHLMKPTTWIQLGVDTTVSAAYKTACTSLQWCKFLSVLSAAVVISLSKGPEDIKRSPY